MQQRKVRWRQATGITVDVILGEVFVRREWQDGVTVAFYLEAADAIAFGRSLVRAGRLIQRQGATHARSRTRAGKPANGEPIQE